MQGLMQHWPLTVNRILEHAKIHHGTREVVTRTVEGPIVRQTYADVYDRAKQVSAALAADGVRFGDVIGSIGWSTARNMEAWYGAMGLGIVVHTINPRLHPDQIAQIINHAEDKFLFLDLSFVPLLESLADKLPRITRYVVLTDSAHMPETTLPNAIAFEDWIAGKPMDAAWGGFPEGTACGLCYTSGTTGAPKGVLYSHRSNVLHTLLAMQRDSVGVSARDVVMPIAPMFHANAWGVVFICPAVGAKLVMPGPKFDGASIFELLDSEKVSFAGAVPTVWLGLLQHLEETGKDLPHLQTALIGGAAVSEHVLATLEDKYGVDVHHGWGMTETSPLGGLGSLSSVADGLSPQARRKMKLKQGRATFMLEMKVVDEDGAELPRDGKSQGRLMVRGPAVAGGYLKGDGASAFQPDGFFDTGDLATIDPNGIMQITDRAKDVIKSGGEWISSVEIETIAMGAPCVACAAVIGVPHPKWDERPLLIVEPKPGVTPDKDAILKHLDGKIAKWWMPDDVAVIEKIPLGATGKINKLALREMFKAPGEQKDG
jgi:fatty-acyl-CoA synthase